MSCILLHKIVCRLFAYTNNVRTFEPYKQPDVRQLKTNKMSIVKTNQLKEVYKLLGRNKLNKMEQSMFEMFWLDKAYKFGVDNRGLLCVHLIGRE